MHNADESSEFALKAIKGATTGVYGIYSLVLLVMAVYILRKYAERKNVAAMAMFLLIVGVAFVLGALSMGLALFDITAWPAKLCSPLFSLMWHCGFQLFLWTQLRTNRFLYIKNQLPGRYKILVLLLGIAAVLEATRIVLDTTACFSEHLPQVSDILMPFVYGLYGVIMFTILIARKQYEPRKYFRHAGSYLTIEAYFVLVLVVTIAYSLMMLFTSPNNLQRLVMRLVLDCLQGLLPVICVRFIFEILHKHQPLSPVLMLLVINPLSPLDPN